MHAKLSETVIVWVLVSEPGFFLGLGPFPWKSNLFTRNEAQEQHSLLDTIFDYIFDFGPPGKYLYVSPQNLLYVCLLYTSPSPRDRG